MKENFENLKQMSVVFCTCEKYKALWGNCFLLIRRYWPELESTIYMNTDMKTDLHIDGLNIVNADEDRPTDSWSKLLFECLRKVKEPVVLLFLDDYYLQRKPDLSTLSEMVGKITAKKAKFVDLMPVETRERESESPEFKKRGPFKMYRICAQAVLFDKKYLMKLLRKNENPWEFEVCGTFRSWFHGSGFYEAVRNGHYVFDYGNGNVVRRGEYDSELRKQYEEKEMISFVELPESNAKGSSPLTFKQKIKIILKAFGSLFSNKMR